MYEQYLDTAARHGFGALIGGLDYRASPDWAARLGYSRASLADAQRQSIGFLRDVAEPYRGQLPDIRYAGIVGPRGDAYTADRTITADEAAEYHRVQLENLVASRVDLAEAMTFNNVSEAIGVARAAAEIGLPLSVSFTLDSTTHRLASGPSLRDAIESVDAELGESRPMFYGINCSHPLEFAAAIEPGDSFDRVRCVRPNAALMDKIALCSIGHLEEGDPDNLGELAGDLARQFGHINVWGGCCGTWSTHLEQIARNVGPVRQYG